MFFAANDDSTGRELWRSGGNKASTKRVKDINPDVGGPSPGELTKTKKKLSFQADYGSSGAELWKRAS